MASPLAAARMRGDEERNDLLEAVYRQGYVVLNDCIDAELLASVNARADELYAEQAKATPAETEQPEFKQANASLHHQSGRLWTAVLATAEPPESDRHGDVDPG